MFSYLQFELSYVKSILKTTQGPSVDKYLFANEEGFSCDCSNIEEVQRFLQDYAYIIRDASDIFCKEDSGKNIAKLILTNLIYSLKAFLPFYGN